MTVAGQKVGAKAHKRPTPRGLVRPTERKLDVARRYRDGEPVKVIFLETGMCESGIHRTVREVAEWEKFERSRGGR